MIEIYSVLETQRERVLNGLLIRIPREIPAYARVNRGELRQSLEYLLEAWTDLLVTGENESQRTYFKFLAKVRSSQSFRLGDVAQKHMMFLPVLREIIVEEMGERRGDLKLMNQALEAIERSAMKSLGLFIDTWHQVLESRKAEHDEYVKEQNEQIGLDLSKFILFRG